MNKISLISLALSFLFTITSGCVHSSDGEGDNVSTEQQATSDSSSDATEQKADDSEKKETKKRSKKKRKTKKHSKSIAHRGSKPKGSQYTTDLNKKSLDEAQATETTQK